MNKMKNFKRRFSLSVPRTETIEESLTEFTEQFNQLNNRRNEGKEPQVPATVLGMLRSIWGQQISPPQPPQPFAGGAALSVLLSPSIQQG